MNTEKVLEIFKEITTVPRESGHEEPMMRWLTAWAESHSLPFRTDKAGNVLISRPAAKGKENIPVLVLQAHQDMVCEKNGGVVHDFRKDPVSYVIKDGWMIAPDTTLGADDGIGIAAALALLEDDRPTGPVECLFTTSEETGMDGAENMEKGFFTGTTLINLDSEDEGQLFIGCAGGLKTSADFGYTTTDLDPSYKCLKLTLSGCVGGHSGDDIDKGRINAVQSLVRFLYGEIGEGWRLVDLRGGGRSNAIARECRAIVAVRDPEAFSERFSLFGNMLRHEYHNTDSGVKCTSEPAEQASVAVDDAEAVRIITSLFACPHGVVAMSQDVPGLVQTSTNLASVKMENGHLTVSTSQRSPSPAECRMIAGRVGAALSLGGAVIGHYGQYPGWEPNPDSKILAATVASYRKLFNAEPMVRAIHAGLECGLFLDKFGGLDMISFGPTLRGVHAPGERLELASLDKFVALLEDVVCNFK